jgi:catechol 2,3-dioxygenase-like lactoylglutathione lyase family enzyme
MIANGNATVHVSDMDAAIRFFSGALGLTLTNRFGRQWATLEAAPSYWTTEQVGAGLVIGCIRDPRKRRRPKPRVRSK